MTNFAAERPTFFEGQYIGADDLEAIVEYLRVTTARQNLGQHTWGVAIGLEIVSQTISDTAVEYYIQPGVAIDGYGRIIVVSTPALVSPDQFVSAGSGDVDIWIRYEQSESEAVRSGFKVCSAQDEYRRVSETFAIEVGSKISILDRQSGVTVNKTLVNDAREALVSVNPEAALLCDASIAHQQLPVDDENDFWLIPLGHVKWSAATNSFSPLVDPKEQEELEGGISAKTTDQVYESLMASRAKRRLIGCVGESIYAADGVIRLRERTRPFDEAVLNDSECKKRKIQSADLKICKDELKPKELIWLEGDTRITGDARLFNGRLEFKDSDGLDYIERTVEGNKTDIISPLLIQRKDGNPKGGSDLQIMLGATNNGNNRLAIGSIEFSGKELCDLSIDEQNKVVIQDNGRLGIGTVNPDNELQSPYTVRGLTETIVENEGTEQENTYDIYRLESYESEAGVQQWQMDLWDTEDTDRKSLNFTESNLVNTRLFLETGGNIGIGTTDPAEQLHIKGDDPAIFIDINPDSGLHTTDVKFGSDGSINARLFWSKNSDKLFINHNGNNAIVVDNNNIGMGTTNPQVRLHVATGNDVTLGDNSGYFVLGSVNGNNVAFDNNEIQARNDGSTSRLTVQHQGGDFAVHATGDSRFVVKDSGRVGIGTDTPGESFEISDSNSAPRIRFRQGSQVSSIGHVGTNNDDISIMGGNVGIGTNSPSCRLHVRGNLNEAADFVDNHIACIQNDSTGSNADVLALRVNNSNPGSANNYITFFDSNSAVGRIERNTLGNLQLLSGGADFAESLPLLEAFSTDLQAGDVVGVYQGKLSLHTEHADQVLVVSDRAVVVGNAALMDSEQARATVAFVGQVKVNVLGPVKAGDLLIPSGLNDGTAISLQQALKKNNATPIEQIVGQAWEDKEQTGVESVNCAVSLLSSALTTVNKALKSQYENRLSSLEQKIAALTKRLDSV